MQFSVAIDNATLDNLGLEMEPVPSNVIKTYPQRGPLQQFRFAESTAFRCFKCGASKKSKLITIYTGSWSKRLCNGCYGQLLSLYKIKAGARGDDERSEALASALLAAVARQDRREAERLFRTNETRAAYLTPEAVRFIATAEHIAAKLQSEPQLEWSPAVIGLCKAVEFELVSRILLPLAKSSIGADLSVDRNDKDLRRVVNFCVDQSRPTPELGTFAHFLQTVIHSRRRRETSTIIRNFLQLAGDWTGSNWILDPASFYQSLNTLTTNFRNRAAHIDELAEHNYLGCRDLVIGAQGVIWKLVEATKRHR